MVGSQFYYYTKKANDSKSNHLFETFVCNLNTEQSSIVSGEIQHRTGIIKSHLNLWNVSALTWSSTLMGMSLKARLKVERLHIQRFVMQHVLDSGLEMFQWDKSAVLSPGVSLLCLCIRRFLGYSSLHHTRGKWRGSRCCYEYISGKKWFNKEDWNLMKLKYYETLLRFVIFE